VTAPGKRTLGRLRAGHLVIPVTLGRSGMSSNKREGDGSTPRGLFHPLRLWWRKDRGARPATSLPVHAISKADGWCEDPTDRRYNRAIRVAPDAVGDRLARTDHLYDYIIEIDHNTRPRIANRGSAVFIHLMRDDMTPTAGCVGLKRDAMLRLLAQLTTKTKIVIG
jgi:L,D-peptidoglycan transpeptidase YkuD (ErfK/YbiS/YcfS/YnhG family)